MFNKLTQRIKEKRGHLQNNLEQCTFCGICRKKCLAKAITVEASNRAWKVDNKKMFTVRAMRQKVSASRFGHYKTITEELYYEQAD